MVAIDTSGSVSHDDLVEFFNETYHIYKSGTYVDIIECDAKVQRVYEYKGEREDSAGHTINENLPGAKIKIVR